MSGSGTVPFLSPVDLNRNELRNAVVQVLGTAPSGPIIGLIYSDSTLDEFLWYSATRSAWISLDATKVPLQNIGAPTAAVSLNSQKITNLATPTASTDAANKSYVDSAVQAASAGVSGKGSCVAVATTNQASMTGLAVTIDGVALSTAGMRVLLTGQTTASQNGPWVVAAGAWTRPTTDANNELETGALWFIEKGTVNAATNGG
jgi:hypothetical protein